MEEEKEKIKALRLKEKILLIELQAVRQQIALYIEMLKTVNSVQEDESLKTESIPLQTAKGKEKSSPLIPDALGKSIHMAKDEPQSSSSPVANGSGKDDSNPFMADSLPKTIKTTYAQKVTSPGYQKSKFYVIFDGDHRGIYEDWAIVSNYVQHTTVPYKKFGSLLQAQQEATRYSAEFGKKEIPLKINVFPLPVTKTKKTSPVNFSNLFEKRIEKKFEIQNEEIDLISLDEFRSVWSKARALSPEDFEVEHVFTEDKMTKSLYNFCPGADPRLVNLAFSAGLIKNIYPSANLQEINLFTEGMKKAIKTFRKKIAAAKDANIYIECTSALPDWYQGKSFPALHILEIGIAKIRNVQPSKIMEEQEDVSNWVSLRVNSYLKILNTLSQITVGSFKKINYCSQNCVIISYSGTPLPVHEKHAIETIEQRIISNQLDVGPATKKLLCQELARIIEDHACEECRESDNLSEEETTKDTRELDPTHGYID